MADIASARALLLLLSVAVLGGAGGVVDVCGCPVVDANHRLMLTLLLGCHGRIFELWLDGSFFADGAGRMRASWRMVTLKRKSEIAKLRAE
jgi:hypothetical protein